MSPSPQATSAPLIEALDGLLRGLNHALSNRINTLNTLLAVLQEHEGADREIVDALAKEEVRFEELLRLYRLMPMDMGAEREPMVLVDPVKDAVLLFAHHLDVRMLQCTVDGVESAPPVRSRRQALTLAILVLLVVVARPVAEDEDEAGILLRVTATADEVHLRASATVPTPIIDESALIALEWLTAALDMTTTRGMGEDKCAWAELTLPTLAAERKKGR